MSERMIAPTGAPTERIRVTEVRAGASRELEDEAAAEEPLEIRVLPANAREGERYRIAVTMRTPGSDFELAAGFLASEGLLRGAEDVRRIEYCAEPGEPQEFNIVNVRLAPGVPFDAERYRRNVYTTSSCGVCGKAAIEQITTTVARRPVGRFQISPTTLGSLPERVRPSQRVFGRTGGLHAAGLFRPDGELLLAREDVGRHNAVDKLVGMRLLARALPDSNTILLVTGRAGFELVQKAAVAGIPFLAAIGAPSTLAIALAREQGMTLVGFLREDRFNIYAGAERVGPSNPKGQSTSGT
jgi:FdhD protein